MSDRRYHAMRAHQERLMADEASDPKIASLHRQLAERHEQLATSNGAEVPLRDTRSTHLTT